MTEADDTPNGKTPSAIHITTLGAPLTPEEVQEMLSEFIAFQTWAMSTTPQRIPDDLWPLATKIVDWGFRVRGTVERVCRVANDRAFQKHYARHTINHLAGKEPAKKSPAVDLSALGLDQFDPADVLAAIESHIGGKK